MSLYAFFKLVNYSKALDALLSDLKENPKRYVHFSIFGRKEKSSDDNKK